MNRTTLALAPIAATATTLWKKCSSTKRDSMIRISITKGYARKMASSTQMSMLCRRALCM